MSTIPFAVAGAGRVPLFIRIMPLIVIGVVVYVIGGNLYTWYRNETSPVEERLATVMAKRTRAFHHGNRGVHRSPYVTFQFDNGERLELPVNWHDYGSLVEGEDGLLNYQGTRFNGFRRH